MKKLLLALVLTTLTIFSVSANMPGTFNPIFNREKVKVVFQDSASSTSNLSSYTFAMNFGTAFNSRCIVIGFGAGGGSVGTITGVTIAGNAANIINQSSDARASGYNLTLASLLVPTGTSGNVVGTLSASKGRAAALLWALSDTNCSGFNYVSQTGQTGVTSTIVGNSVTNGAFTSFCFQTSSVVTNPSLTTVVTDIVGNVESVGYGGGHLETPNGASISTDCTNTTNIDSGGYIGASWRN